jgi:thiamine-phosphate pyrophosphorylase
MKPLAQCQLYTFVDTAWLQGRSPELLARQLCDGGSDLIQLRAKNSTLQEIRQLAARLLPITEAAAVGLVINDHLQIALELGAPLCHLGQEDFFDAGHTRVDQLLPAQSPLALGLSSHALPQAERAVAAGAAYVAIGPVFATSTKPLATPVTLEYVRWAAAHIRIPWFAIGGITLENLDSVLAAGARRICVVSAILKSANIVKTCQNFKNRLNSLPAT